MCGLIASGDGPAAAFRRMAALHRRFGVEEIRRAAGAADARMWHDGVSAVGDEQELSAMVRDINRTQVRDTEILSDNIYLYSPVSGKLTLIES